MRNERRCEALIAKPSSLNSTLRFANLGSAPAEASPYVLSAAPVDADPP
jgi:hypothetical protein